MTQRFPRRHVRPLAPRLRARTTGRHPRPGVPLAVYARILDGETLWLAVADLPSGDTRLCLRERVSGEVVPLDSEVLHLAGRPVLSSRTRLARPPEPAGAPLEFDLLADDPSYAGPQPVRGGRGLPPGPTRVPPSRDGAWQLTVDVDATGVVVTHRPLPPTAWLLQVTADQAVVRLGLDLPAGVAPRLLLTEHDEVVDDLPLEAGDGGWRAELGPATWAKALAPTAADRLLPLACGAPQGRVGVRRRDSVLRAPTLAVVLPSLPTPPGSPGPAPRLRYVEGGMLAVAVPAGPTGREHR